MACSMAGTNLPVAAGAVGTHQRNWPGRSFSREHRSILRHELTYAEGIQEAVERIKVRSFHAMF